MDVKLTLQERQLDVLGLAETFLREEEEANAAGYVWYGRNRQGSKRASGGVGILVRKELHSRQLPCQREGVVWVELKLRGEKKIAVGVIYANPEGVRIGDTEAQFENLQEEVARLQGEGFEVVVMGDFNAHIGLGDEQQPNKNGQRLLNVMWAGGLVIGNELPQCQGRWTWECGQKRSVIDYILFSRGLAVERMQIENWDPELASNYRGIALGSCVAKVLTRLLSKRLSAYAEEEILTEAQGGFRSERRCADQILILRGVCELRRKEKKGTYVAFLDVSKAYDTVWREGLWKKMEQYGIEDKFVRICRGLYEGVEASVVLESGKSRWFPVETGLRQGCPLSPLLYSIYVMGMMEQLEEKSLGVKMEGTWCGGLMYADDVVLMAESSAELQEMLDVVGRYAHQWKFRFNARKSKTMVVGTSGGESWSINGEVMEEVEAFKYLGVWLDRKMKGNVQFERMREKAEEWAGRTEWMSRVNGQIEVERGRQIWELLARPSLEHAASVWWTGGKVANRK